MSILVKHVRVMVDGVKTPIATLVAVGRDKVGMSICCQKDQFSKKMGVKIAHKRALNGHVVDIPNRRLSGFNGNICTVLELAELEMHNRALKYYKQDHIYCSGCFDYPPITEISEPYEKEHWYGRTLE